MLSIPLSFVECSLMVIFIMSYSIMFYIAYNCVDSKSLFRFAIYPIFRVTALFPVQT